MRVDISKQALSARRAWYDIQYIILGYLNKTTEEDCFMKKEI
jgi:hypothetical protein